MDFVAECGSSRQSGVLQSPPFSFLTTQLSKLSLFARNLELLKPREVDTAYTLGPVVRYTAAWRQGFRATYMGKETVDTRIVGALLQTFDCIDRLLERHNPDLQFENTDEQLPDDRDFKHEPDVFVDVRALDNSLSIYEVNDSCRVTAVRHFDLTRISFCSGAAHPGHEHRLLAWLYRQETDTGFRLDCHVVKLASPTRARKLARLIGLSFDRAYANVIEGWHDNERRSPAIPAEHML